MTPERQKWWDSLPKEEKRVRLAIEKERRYMSLYKNDGALNISGFIKYQKLLIKNLRKQLAMRPIKDQHEWYEVCLCPRCFEMVYNFSPYNKPDEYCHGCGQKLRWK